MDGHHEKAKRHEAEVAAINKTGKESERLWKIQDAHAQAGRAHHKAEQAHRANAPDAYNLTEVANAASVKADNMAKAYGNYDK
jgi:hypothetical protein